MRTLQSQVLRVIAVDNPATHSIELHFHRDRFDKSPIVVEALQSWDEWDHGTAFQFVPVEEGAILPQAPFRINREHAQTLMDQLYRAGLRPRDAQATGGQIEAMQAHLADLRLSHTALLGRVS